MISNPTHAESRIKNMVMERAAPDVIVIDVRMPMMDGEELANHLDKFGIPIILTSCVEPHKKPTRPFLIKPSYMSEYQEFINEVRRIIHSEGGYHHDNP